MATIITRAGKGAPLTHNEVDANFTNLNSGKAELASTNTFSASQIISANSSSDALRITQTGAGNALVVEDEANPDSTPFVVDANGIVIAGTTTAYNSGSGTLKFQSVGDGTIAQGFSAFGWANSATFNPRFEFAKSRSGTIGTHTVVQSGDTIGLINFNGSDGTAFITAASITSAVDGTPGTNDMPGRLVFSTTADGASSPTERMRITNSGGVGIGGTPAGSSQLNILGTLVSASNISRHVSSAGTAPTTSTTEVTGFFSNPSTTDGIGAVTAVHHFYAFQGTLTGGTRTAPTNQYGFRANSNLTGATNNYGFYSDIASGTGRWNFYANGTADNYFAGEILQGSPNVLTFAAPAGTLTPTIQAIAPVSSLTQGFASTTHVNSGNGPNFVFGKSRGASATSPTIVSSGDVLGNISFNGYDGTTYQMSAFIQGVVDGTPGASDMPGRLGFWTTADGASSPTERMRIDNAGRVTIGSSPNTDATLSISRAHNGTFTYGILNFGQIPATATSGTNYFRTSASTAAATFTTSLIAHFSAGQVTFGAGSTVTNQYGFEVQSSLTGATNNYGFYSNIASGTGRWNFYAAGTAANAFSGDVKIFGAGGLGYATGSGGAVTQATDRTTGVTLDKTNGAITLVSAAGTTTWQTFTVTNNTVAATDTIIVNQKSGTDLYEIHVTNVAAGSFKISFKTTGGTTTEQPVFNFAVIKAVAA